MRILLALWRLLDRRQRRQLVLLQGVAVLMAFSTVGGIAAVLPFFTVLADPGAAGHGTVLNFLHEHLSFGGERSVLFALGVGFALVVVFANIVNLLGSLAMNRFAFQVGDAFYTALFDEYLHRPYRFHSSTHSSTLLSKVVHDTGRVTTGILQSALVLATSLVTIVCVVGAIVLLNPLVAACAIFGLGASYTAIYLVARAKLLRNGLTESRCFARRNQVVGESLAAIREVILLRAQRFFVEDFTRYCKSISATIVSTLAISQSPRYVLECAMVCSLVAVALYLSSETAGTSPWIAQLSFIALAAYRLLPALQQAYSAIVRIRADRPAFESVAVDLQLARAARRAADPAANDRFWRGRPLREIRLESVSFRYAADRPAAISNASVRIPAGATVGFIGANGSGKTTLTDLVAGLVVPESGHLEVDGIVLDDTNRGAWQSTIAYVPQQILLLDSTVAGNIALGVPSAQIDRERLRVAVRMARLEEYVASLPNGCEELIGERGGRLSGGQRQRLGIARALYRDASVLILDEATSSLDPAAEQEIIDVLAALGPGRTILIVAHRLSALQNCDIVFELESGQIVRTGNSAELLTQRSARHPGLRATGGKVTTCPGT